MLVRKRRRNGLRVSNFTLEWSFSSNIMAVKGLRTQMKQHITKSETLKLENLLKDSSVRSIWTYLTARPCHTTNTNKHDCTTDTISIWAYHNTAFIRKALAVLLLWWCAVAEGMRQAAVSSKDFRRIAIRFYFAADNFPAHPQNGK